MILSKETGFLFRERKVRCRIPRRLDTAEGILNRAKQTSPISGAPSLGDVAPGCVPPACCCRISQLLMAVVLPSSVLAARGDHQISPRGDQQRPKSVLEQNEILIHFQRGLLICFILFLNSHFFPFFLLQLISYFSSIYMMGPSLCFLPCT